VPFSTGLVVIVTAALDLIASYNKGYIVRSKYVKVVLMWVGSRSYALYLIRYSAFAMAMTVWWYIEPRGPVFGPNYTLRYVAVWLAILLSLAELNYRFIETPLRRKGRQMQRGGYAVRHKNLASRAAYAGAGAGVITPAWCATIEMSGRTS